MKNKLGYKYEIIEKKYINRKEIFKVRDIFDDNVVFLEEYKSAKDLDWDDGEKIEKELNELKNKNLINDYFYNNDYEAGLKIYYKVFNEFEDFDNLKEEDEDDGNKEEKDGTEDVKAQINKFNDKEEVKANATNGVDKKIYKLNEIGGKVKLEPEKIENYADNLIHKDKVNLELNFKKSAPRYNIKKKLYCKVCQSPIDKEKVDYGKGIAYCEKCKAVREVKDNSFKKIELTSIVPPKGITLKDNGDFFSIKFNLNRISGILIFLITLVIYYIFTTEGNGFERIRYDVVFNFIFFSILTVSGYSSLVQLFNSVTVTIGKNDVIFSSSPLFYFPKKVIKVESIKQVYVKRIEHRRKGGQIYYDYRLMIILKNGKEKSVLSLFDADYALYLEKIIELKLSIENFYVPGEFKET